MKRVANGFPICALALVILSGASAGCRARGAPARTEAAPAGAPQPGESTVPLEIAAVASTVLGRSAEVIAFGDLAHNGREQVLVANRTGVADEVAKEAQPGVRFTRAAVLERAGTKWSEVLRCDEYLKNPSGYLGGVPLQPVTSWRVELSEQNDHQERELRFTPLRDSGATSMLTVSVRWNPAASRYQSLDPSSGKFLAEVSTLETPVSPLR